MDATDRAIAQLLEPQLGLGDAGAVIGAATGAASSVIGAITGSIAASRAQKAGEARSIAEGQAFLNQAVEIGRARSTLSGFPWLGVGIGVVIGGGVLVLVLKRRR